MLYARTVSCEGALGGVPCVGDGVVCAGQSDVCVGDGVVKGRGEVRRYTGVMKDAQPTAAGSDATLPPLLFDCFGVFACLQDPESEQRLYQLALGAAVPLAENTEVALPFTFERFAEVYRGVRKPYDAGEWLGPDYWKVVSQQLGTTFTPEQVDALIAEDLYSWRRVDESMLGYLAELSAAGYPLGLLSNIPVELAEVFRTKPWLQHFDSITWSCDLGAAKPDVRTFEHAAEQMGVPVEELTFIDDTQENCDGAAIAGLRAHLFVGEGELREFIAELTEGYQSG